MIKILENYDITTLNTFGVKAKVKFFVEINNEPELKELFKSPGFKNNPKLFLGGGSNILFTKDFEGLVILNKLQGIEVLKEDEKNVWIKSMGGDIWNDLVVFSVDKGYWGIENLALIPGTVGAAPIQNIGAYGVELKDVLEEVECYEIETGEKKIFKNKECNFGYRDSIFKNELKGKYFISSIILKLNKFGEKNVNYKILQEYLETNKITINKSKDVSDAITFIRQSKLPNPKIIGNAGSFFKNIYISNEKFEKFKKNYPEIPHFKEEELIKIPSGWLIEQCGPRQGGASWKGYRQGSVGVHNKQALVLVNYGGATGEEVYNLAKEIIDSVYKKFGLNLIPEVNLIP